MKVDKKPIIKDDINFLENPTWVVDEKSNLKEYVIRKGKGVYEIKGTEGLPTRFDKIVLYYLLYKLLDLTQFEQEHLTTTRYEIARNVFANKKHIGKIEYDRVMYSLKKWSGIAIKFEGIFYEGDEYTFRLFHILEDVILHKGTSQLYIKFNQQYIKQLKETKFYKLIDFKEYKRLSRSLSARLYEILVKNFKERTVWQIHIDNLAEKLTLHKRPDAKRYYPSDVLVKLKPAIIEINKNTTLQLECTFDKASGLCTFVKLHENIKVVETTTQLIKSAAQKTTYPLVEVLIAYGVNDKKAEEICEHYAPAKIKHKLALLKHAKEDIKNITAWLLKALEEDWDAQAYTHYTLELKAKEEAARRRKEEEVLKKRLQELKTEYTHYKETKAQELYTQLPPAVRKHFDAQFTLWLQEKKQAARGFAMPESVYKQQFLTQVLLDEEEQDFEKWAAGKGHILVKAGADYAFLQ